jgi:hypothetical protein
MDVVPCGQRSCSPKYGRPPLGDNIPPFADTVNVTAVLI